MSAKEFLLIGFAIVLFLMVLLLITYSRKTAGYCRSLEKELENLKEIVKDHRPDNLPQRAFQRVLEIHHRCLMSKKALSGATRLSAYFLTLTTIWLQTPVLVYMFSDVRLFSESFSTAYAVFQTMTPCVAFTWLIWKIQDSSSVIVRLKEMISRCQLEALPSRSRMNNSHEDI